MSVRPQEPALLVGGRGHVGSRLAALLVGTGQPVVIAGRDAAGAHEAAERLGPLARGCRLDVDDPDAVAAAVEQTAVVYSCVDATTSALVDTVVARGRALVDISADPDGIARARRAAARARRTGARVVVGAGLHPGIANVLARRTVERVGPGAHVTTALVVSVGDTFGPAALDYMLAAGAEGGFVSSRRLDLGATLGRQRSTCFPFPDGPGYLETLGVAAAEGRLVVLPAAAGALVAGLGATGILRAGGRRPGVRRQVSRLLAATTGRAGGRTAGTAAIARQPDGTWWRCAVIGEGESDMTAAGTAAMGRLLDLVPPGVWWPQQVFAYEGFSRELARHGLHAEDAGVA